MGIPAHNTHALIEKIQSLPTDRIMEVEDFVDFLHGRTTTQKTAVNKVPLNFPVDNLGSWPDHLSLHRKDMYGDDGR